MIKSPYATKFTREHMAGEKEPSRDMTNRKALEQGERRKRWQAKQAAKRETK